MHFWIYFPGSKFEMDLEKLVSRQEPLDHIFMYWLFLFQKSIQVGNKQDGNGNVNISTIIKSFSTTYIYKI